MSRMTFIAGAAIAALLGLGGATFMAPELETASIPVPQVAVAAPAPPPEPVIVPVAYVEPEEAPLYGHPWIVAGSRGCSHLAATPYVYIDTIRADGVRVDILSEGPNHVTIGDTTKSNLPVQVIVRGMDCQRAQQALAVMRSY